jgi:hypothetical protein
MQVVFEQLPLAQQLDMQLVKRRWFREYGPALLGPIHTETPKLLRMYHNSAYIEVFSPTHLAWHLVFVHLAKKKCRLSAITIRRLAITSKANSRDALLRQRSPSSATREFSLLVEGQGENPC